MKAALLSNKGKKKPYLNSVIEWKVFFFWLKKPPKKKKEKRKRKRKRDGIARKMRIRVTEMLAIEIQLGSAHWQIS